MRLLLLYVAAAALLGGRQTGNAPPTAGKPASGPESPDHALQPAAPQPSSRTPPSDDQARQFGEAFVGAVYEGDVERINSLIDWDAISAMGTDGVEASDEIRRVFIETSNKRLISEGMIAKQLIKVVANGGSWRLLRPHTDGDVKKALFRMIGPDNGLDYYDMPLVALPSGDVKAIDLYSYAKGEGASQSMRRMFLRAVLNEAKLRQSGQQDEIAKHAHMILEMLQAYRQEDYGTALEIYHRLPPVVQGEKSVMITRIQAAAHVSDERLLAAIDDFRAKHPGDPAADLYAIQAHLLRKEHDLALKGLDRVDRAVGGDPYLNVIRASAYFEERKWETAKRLAQQALEAESDLVPAHWTLVNISLRQKDFAATARLLTRIEEQFGFDFDLTVAPEYADFVKSREYDRWMETRRRKAKSGGSKSEADSRNHGQ